MYNRKIDYSYNTSSYSLQGTGTIQHEYLRDGSSWICIDIGDGECVNCPTWSIIKVYPYEMPTYKSTPSGPFNVVVRDEDEVFIKIYDYEKDVWFVANGNSLDWVSDKFYSSTFNEDTAKLYMSILERNIGKACIKTIEVDIDGNEINMI